MQRLNLPLAGQAHGSVLNRLWRSLQAGMQCKSSGDTESATVARTSGRSPFTSAQPSSGPTLDTGPRCTLPPQSRPQGVFPPDRTRGFAASAADSASYPASFKTDWQEERDDGCPKSLEEYNDVLLHLARRLRTDTMRDVFDDLVLDGITPDRSTFHTILGANMRAKCLEDVLYYYDRMMMQGLIPDSTLFHIILRACARARQIDKAFEVAEEMEAVGTPHTAKTYQHLLNVCAKAGHVAKANEVVEKMRAKGLVLNKFCYAALIEATGNQRPHPGRDSTGRAIMRLFEEARRHRDAWTDPYEYIPASGRRGRARPDYWEKDEEDHDESEDLVVYKAAVGGCATIFYQPGVLAVAEAMKEDKVEPDARLMNMTLELVLVFKRFEEACQILDDHPNARLGTSSADVKKLLTDAIFGKHVPLITRMLQRLINPSTRTYLSAKDGNDLLSMTAKLLRKVDISVCRLMWDTLDALNIQTWLGPAKDYFRALTVHQRDTVNFQVDPEAKGSVQVNGFKEDDPHYIEVQSRIALIASRVLSKTPFKAPRRSEREQKDAGQALDPTGEGRAVQTGAQL